jgi:biopolymer transport protein ExbD
MRLPLAIENESADMTPMIDVVFQLLIFFMLTMHFQEVEGKMLSQLPKHKGPVSAPSRITEEVRILIRDGRLSVEKHEIGALGTSANKPLYAAAAEKARGLVDVLGEASLILDAEGTTAYEHVIGLLDALKERKLESIEFAGDPKFSRYYGKP